MYIEHLGSSSYEKSPENGSINNLGWRWWLKEPEFRPAHESPQKPALLITWVEGGDVQSLGSIQLLEDLYKN